MASRIAVVDADPIERVAVASALRAAGHDVREWYRADAALGVLLEQPPDLLLVSAELRDASGLDLVARLRARHAAAFPILLVASDPGDAARARAVGATDARARPLEPAELAAAAERLLQPGAGESIDLPRDARGLTFGRYDVRGVLGRGGSGVVYEARDEQRGEDVALKVLAPVDDADAETLARFVREARALSRVDDPHVVRMLDAGVAEGRAYCAMRRVHGPTLEAHLREEGALSELQGLALLCGLLDALDALAEHDLVHRDITPRNVLLERGRVVRPVLIDFRLAKPEQEPGLTAHGQLLGTPGFIAPEVIQGAEADARSDLYSVGLVVVYALEGRHPFPPQRAMALLRTMAEVPPPIPARLSPPARDLLRRLTALDPAERPRSARAALEELAALARALAAPPKRDTRRLVGVCA